MKFKFELKSLKKPTPKTMRLLGNALMVVGATVGTSVYANIPWVGVAAFVLGLVAKFITEFYVEE